jgi:hypothetical protein
MRTERQKGGKSGRQADIKTEGWKGRQTGSKRDSWVESRVSDPDPYPDPDPHGSALI